METVSTEAVRLGAGHVRDMFSRIAGRYDFLNHLLSANRDRAWRRRAVEAAHVASGEVVVDLCTGTGDLAQEFRRRTERVYGLDFCVPMLARALAKAPRAAWAAGDSLHLPLPESCADVVSVAFGIRNVVDLDGALTQMHRILRPGGRLVILEFTPPQGPVFGRLWRFYFHGVLPRLAGLFSEHSAYSYLPRSVAAFPDAEGLSRRIAAAGFAEARYETMSLGIVALHLARRP